MLDLALLAIAYYAAFRFRFQGEAFTHFLPYFATSFPLILACQLGGLAIAGKYRQVWRLFGAAELMGILKGVAIGFAGSALLMLYMYGFVGFSRLVFVIDAVLLVFFVVGSRLLITSLDSYLRTRRGGGRRVLIYGAGGGGRLLVHALLEDRTFLLLPIGFIDDDPAKRRLHVDGVPVLGTIDDLPHLLADRRGCRTGRHHQVARSDTPGRSGRHVPRTWRHHPIDAVRARGHRTGTRDPSCSESVSRL